VDELLLAAFAPIERDLRAAGLDGELVGETGETGESGEPRAAVEHSDGYPRGDVIVSGVKLGHVLVDPAQDRAWQVQGLADYVQKLVQEHVRTFGGSPLEWPPCLPSHVHPMAAGVSGGEATWYCPLDSAIAVRIGSHP
jgi:hypothetical protein